MIKDNLFYNSKVKGDIYLSPKIRLYFSSKVWW